MTVAEAIAVLATLPPNAPLLYLSEYGKFDAVEISQIDMARANGGEDGYAISDGGAIPVAVVV